MAKQNLPSGISLITNSTKHFSNIISLAWSPDGSFVATGSRDESIKIWTGDNAKLVKTDTGHVEAVTCLAWSQDGKFLASGSRNVRILNVKTHEWLRTILERYPPLQSIAWSPDGSRLATGSHGRVCIWDPWTGELKRELHGFPGLATSIAWSQDSRVIASSSLTQIILWDILNGKVIRKINGHSQNVLSIAWSPDGQILASGSEDATISLWDTKTWRHIGILEGHSAAVVQLSFSDNGNMLASEANDIRLWRCDTWDILAAIMTSVSSKVTTSGWPSGTIAFRPKTSILATLGSASASISLWNIDFAQLSAAKPISESVRYTNAKVVLVGDTGVGKSGLGLVLADPPFRATDSTHSRRVWTFDSSDVTLEDGTVETREILLWDMAGQPGYRLVHQLHLNEVSLALIVFDARSETDPFAGVRHWDRALRQAQRIQEGSAPPLTKFLVVARTDRGGIGVSNTRMARLLKELSISTCIETSAKEGKNIEELSNLIKAAVPWNLLPKVRSTELFQRIKTFILTEKKAGRILTNGDDFYRSFLNIDKISDSLTIHAQFDACIGRVESRDLIKRLSFGNLVLLQPELLDVYASAMVNAAKEEPDGLGCITEDDASSGRFPVPSEDRLEDSGLERLLLIATVESLLKHEIAFKEMSHEGVQLVFPSQFTREHPDLPDPQGKTAILNFEGPVVAIYATLAVRLSRSNLFHNKDMWRNAAVFEANVGGTCGMVIREVEEGRGELTLFFNSEASRDTRFHFEEYIYTHLRRWAIPESITLKRIVTCSGCGLIFTDQFIKMMAERKLHSVQCQVCSTVVSLLSEEESLADIPPSVVSEMDQAADSGRDRETAAIMLNGKIATGDFDVFLCHNSKDKSQVIDLGNRLKERGILPWLDVWEIRPGQRWQRVLEENISKVKAAAVICGKKGFGPWQDLEEEAILAQFAKRKCPVIPVILADCKKEPKVPLFLQGMHQVDFRREYPDPFEQLVWGIIGKRPT